MKYDKLSVFLVIFGFSNNGFAKAAESLPNPKDIIANIEKNLAPPNVEAKYAFTNHRTDGTITSYEVQLKIKDVNHAHIYFLKPEREKGREILRLDDVLWSFVPNIGRTIRIADRDSFAGGDFSNADILRVDWLSKYTPQIIKDLPNQWIIELKSHSNDASYAKMRLWVNKKNGQPVQQQFFDSQGVMLKKLLYGSVKRFDNIERPTRLAMENVITKQKTELEIIELKEVGNIPESRFVIDNLGK